MLPWTYLTYCRKTGYGWTYTHRRWYSSRLRSGAETIRVTYYRALHWLWLEWASGETQMDPNDGFDNTPF